MPSHRNPPLPTPRRPRRLQPSRRPRPQSDGATPCMTPTGFDSVERLEEFMSRPSPAAVDGLRRAPGDIIILGVGGKMGYTLARMARRAADEAGAPRRIIGVSRF